MLNLPDINIKPGYPALQYLYGMSILRFSIIDFFKMILKCTFLMVFLLAPGQILLPQDPNIIWKTDFSLSHMCSRDQPAASIMYNDSVLYVTGISESNFSNYDVTTIAFNVSGDTIWARTFSTYKNDFSYDTPQKICSDKEGNVYVFGHRKIDYANEALFVVKYDRYGNLLWNDITEHVNILGINTTLTGNDFLTDDSGNLYMLGRYSADLGGTNTFIIKYSPGGRKIWTKMYPYVQPVFFRMDNSGKINLFINTGFNNQFLYSKLDTAGTVLHEIEITSPGIDALKEIIDARTDKYDNIFVFADGWKDLNHKPESQDAYMFRFDSAGDIKWVFKYNGPAGNYDHGVEFNIVGDSLLILGISTWTSYLNLDIEFLKLSYEGKRLDSLFLAGNYMRNDNLISITTDNNLNTYALCNSIVDNYNYVPLALKINSGMELIWSKTISSPPGYYYHPLEISEFSNGKLSMTGSLNSTTNPDLPYETDVDFRINLVDTSGAAIHDFSWSGPGTSNFRSAGIDLDSEGNAYLSGYSQIGPDRVSGVDYFKFNYFLLKYNRDGKLQWNRTIDNDTILLWMPVNHFKYGSEIILIGSGYTDNIPSLYTLIYIYNLNGELLRKRIINNDGYYCNAATIDSAGNIYLYIPRTDNTFSSILKISGELDTIWEYRFVETSQLEETPIIQVTGSGKVYFAGKDHKLIVIGSNGSATGEVDLSSMFKGFSGLYIDSLSNVFISGISTGIGSNKMSFARISADGNIDWHLNDKRMQSVKDMVYQKKSDRFVISGTTCSVSGCTPSLLKSYTSDGRLADSLDLVDIFPKKIICDNDDYIYIMHSADHLVIISPGLDSLWQSHDLIDSIYFNYKLTDISFDSENSIYLTGVYGNRIYLDSNEWNSVTTIKFKRPDTSPWIRNFRAYFRLLPGEVRKVPADITDYEGGNCTITFKDSPGWISFDSQLSQIVFDPDASVNGIFNATMVATDNSGNSTTYNIVIKVGNSAPVFTSTPVLKVNVNENYTYELHAVDSDNDSLTFEIEDGPSWLTLDSNNTLSGIPAESDTCKCPVELIVKDNYGGTGIQNFVIGVEFTVGIQDIYVTNGEKRYLIFPNPADHIIYIKPMKDIPGKVTISLSNLIGNLIFKEDYFMLPSAGEKISIDVGSVKPGLYTLQVHEQERVFSYLIIIKQVY